MVNYFFLNNTFFDISIYQYGYEQCIPHHTFGPGTRNHYIIHFVLSGKGTFCIQNPEQDSYTDYPISAGQAFLIEPRHLIHYYADDLEPWEYMWIEFDGIKAKEYLKQAGLTKEQPIYRTNVPLLDNPAYHHLKTIVDNPQFLPSEVMGYAYLFFSSLIKTSLSAKKIPTNNIQDFYVQSTVDFIEQFYMNDITIEDMAKNINLNRSYFSKLFKKATQKNPQAFLIQYRINKACEFLLSTKMSIAEIATAVGYSNQFHFTRAFKNIMNIPPQEYRKRNLL